MASIRRSQGARCSLAAAERNPTCNSSIGERNVHFSVCHAEQERYVQAEVWNDVATSEKLQLVAVHRLSASTRPRRTPPRRLCYLALAITACSVPFQDAPD